MASGIKDKITWDKNVDQGNDHWNDNGQETVVSIVDLSYRQTVNSQEWQAQNKDSDCEGDELSAELLTVGQTNVCPNNVLWFRGSFNDQAESITLVVEIKLVSSVRASQEVSDSRWHLSGVQVYDEILC